MWLQFRKNNKKKCTLTASCSLFFPASWHILQQWVGSGPTSRQQTNHGGLNQWELHHAGAIFARVVHLRRLRLVARPGFQNALSSSLWRFNIFQPHFPMKIYQHDLYGYLVVLLSPSDHRCFPCSPTPAELWIGCSLTEWYGNSRTKWHTNFACWAANSTNFRVGFCNICRTISIFSLRRQWSKKLGQIFARCFFSGYAVWRVFGKVAAYFWCFHAYLGWWLPTWLAVEMDVSKCHLDFCVQFKVRRQPLDCEALRSWLCLVSCAGSSGWPFVWQNWQATWLLALLRTGLIELIAIPRFAWSRWSRRTAVRWPMWKLLPAHVAM
jgi:hypothetical protein